MNQQLTKNNENTEYLKNKISFLQRYNLELRKELKKIRKSKYYRFLKIIFILKKHTYNSFINAIKNNLFYKSIARYSKVFFVLLSVLLKAYVKSGFRFSKKYFYLKLGHELSFIDLVDIPVYNLIESNESPRSKVDIIIPWYGDMNVIPLISNIIDENSSLIERLIVINDCYPDLSKCEAVSNHIKLIGSKKIEYLSNDVNLGFVGTVNAGMKISKNDVVLLNSDTIPSQKWLESLHDACYVSNKIATSTAISNNATVFSIPKLNQPNIDKNPSETAEILMTIAPFDYIEIPTAHGFCMYIKRSVLKKIGYFDEKTFGKGYGEENDFSMRAKENGFLHVLSSKSYVAHLEAQSFGNKRRMELIAQNYKKLLVKYPYYSNLINKFILENKLKPIVDLYYTFLQNRPIFNKKYNLLINHSDIYREVGGIEKITQDLIVNKKGNYLLYYFDKKNDSYILQVINGLKTIMSFKFSKISKNTDILSWIIRTFNLEKITVNHLINHSLGYADIINRSKIKSYFFIHDYYYLTGSPKKITRKKLLVSENFFNKFDHVIFNSELTRQTYSNFFGKNINKSEICYPKI